MNESGSPNARIDANQAQPVLLSGAPSPGAPAADGVPCVPPPGTAPGAAFTPKWQQREHESLPLQTYSQEEVRGWMKQLIYGFHISEQQFVKNCDWDGRTFWNAFHTQTIERDLTRFKAPKPTRMSLITMIQTRLMEDYKMEMALSFLGGNGPNRIFGAVVACLSLAQAIATVSQAVASAAVLADWTHLIVMVLVVVLEVGFAFGLVLWNIYFIG